ncbi:MAG: hypothetical protein CMH81_06595 [Nitrospiraceae bacterium]|nr:hypothetical protein [Nitrospiraceae bacterium]|tara:strand:- start:24 stop:524 length:501 start_codon:yes stop_codon:yes gene_type:complete
MEAYLELLFRWGHFLAGIAWIGILYYFNFIQAAYLKVVTPEAKAEAFQHLVPNALAWFRYAALWTWVFGILLLLTSKEYSLGEAFLFQGDSKVIGMGAWLGTIMFFNVWMIIWPNQKKVLGMVEVLAEEKPRAARIALLASRTNVVLSIPMLFFMAAAGHAPAGLF